MCKAKPVTLKDCNVLQNNFLCNKLCLGQNIVCGVKFYYFLFFSPWAEFTVVNFKLKLVFSVLLFILKASFF